MSKKQLGAAPGEESELHSGKRLGWFGRLRAQPGFRTAAVAFVLTVVLGVGGPAAYALWSKTFPETITGKVSTLSPITNLTCSTSVWDNTKVSWTAPADMPRDAVFLVTVTKTGGKTGSLMYAFPPGKKGFEPINLSVSNELFHGWMGGWSWSPTEATVAVSVGALDHSITKETKVTQSQVKGLASSTPLEVKLYGSTFLGNPYYICP